MSTKLTDTQLIMLSAAAQRDDRCLVPAPKLKGGAAQKIVGKLMAAGLVKEIKAKAGMPVWRRAPFNMRRALVRNDWLSLRKEALVSLSGDAR
jgi:hypothetical protein